MNDEQLLQDRQRFEAANSGDGWVALYDKFLSIFVTAWYDKHGAFMYADGLRHLTDADRVAIAQTRERYAREMAATNR